MIPSLRPPFPRFQVVLLSPETGTAAAADGGDGEGKQLAARRHGGGDDEMRRDSSTTVPPTKSKDWETATSMLRMALALAADITKPQTRYHGYMPEIVLRSVRALVDANAGRDLLTHYESAIAGFTRHIIHVVEEMMAANHTDEEAPAEEGGQVGTLDSHVLETLTTFWARLRAVLEELSIVWVYLDRCHVLADEYAATRLIEAAGLKQFRRVLEDHKPVLDYAMLEYLAILKKGILLDPTPLSKADDKGSAEEVQLCSTAHAAATAAESMSASPPLSPLQYGQQVCRRYTNLLLSVDQFNVIALPPVVDLARKFYTVMGADMVAEGISAPVYIKYCMTALQREESRCRSYLCSEVSPLMERVVQTTLLGTVTDTIIGRDIVQLMEREDLAAMRLTCQLLSSSGHLRVPTLITPLLKSYTVQCGHAILSAFDCSSSHHHHHHTGRGSFAVVRHMIGLVRLMETVIQNCFMEYEKDLKVHFYDALHTVLAEHPLAFSEQLAAYLDATLKEVEQGNLPFQAPVQQPSKGVAAVGGGAAEESAPVRPSMTVSHPEWVGKGPVVVSAAIIPTATPDATLPVGSAALHHQPPLPTDHSTTATIIFDLIAHIFAYHPKMDLFGEAYWRDLGRRLLHQHREVCREAETYFIQLLRGICGVSFTTKFESMLTDIETSTQLTGQFLEWRRKRYHLLNEEETTEPSSTSASTTDGFDIHLRILTKSFWPSFPSPSRPIWLPSEMRLATKDIETFYAELLSNRQLQWQHSLSHTTLRALLRAGGTSYTLSCTLIQCVLLLLLDSMLDGSSDGGGPMEAAAGIAVADLCAKARLDPGAPEVIGSLLGLCHPRFRLLTVNEAAAPSARAAAPPPPSPTDGGSATVSVASSLLPTDLLRLNKQFTSASSKVRVPFQTRSRVSGETENSDSTKSARPVSEAGYLLEVAVMRSLKAQHRISHADLSAQVSAAVSFPVTSAALKKIIDKMIDRGFMARVEGNQYVYIS